MKYGDPNDKYWDNQSSLYKSPYSHQPTAHAWRLGVHPNFKQKLGNSHNNALVSLVDCKLWVTKNFD